MTILDALHAEFDAEAAATRRMLERIPATSLSWRPHAKSFTAGELGAHLVDCVRWTHHIFSAAALDIDPATWQPTAADTVAGLVSAFDHEVTRGTTALAATDEASLWQPWQMLVRGRLRVERPRLVVFRDFTLNHQAHHRGQLSVYLRLLDVPVPGSYGPTADDARALA